ncbi:hypothetical protein D9757_009056 [Collybiopsis confluens]|uniref:F-box domain-containing protein n=1 Tax=Collybiopsis confluens TaxID=2823264 RepID=A0A8H5HDT8_9AGAR|nr:hypothetical protein D9757_009056 [Collybiopsis confluens]
MSSVMSSLAVSDDNSLQKLTQNALSALDALTQKLGVLDDEPMLERLQRGEAPTVQSFVAYINSFRQDGALRLVEFDQSIAKIDDALVQRLKKTRDGFEGSLNVATSLFAPVWRLSEDILVEIFSLYIKDHDEYFNLTSLWVYPIRSATLNLSCVCSVWHRIIFNRPRFWLTLNLNLDVLVHAYGTARPRLLCSILSDYLSRSGLVPLKLEIGLYDGSYDASCDHAFDLLLRYAARWETLTLDLRSSISHFLAKLQSGDRSIALSKLKHLNTDCSLDDSSIVVLIRSAKLQTLNATDLDLSWSNFCQCDLPSLQKLRISGLGGASIGRFMERMPSLESLELHSLAFTAVNEPDSPLHPSNLRLESLWIHIAGHPKGSVEEISSCLYQSRTVLRKLSVAHFNNDVWDLVRSQPSINELEVTYYQS